jgi:hypothetical protein
MDMLPLAFTDS